MYTSSYIPTGCSLTALALQPWPSSQSLLSLHLVVMWLRHAGAAPPRLGLARGAARVKLLSLRRLGEQWEREKRIYAYIYVHMWPDNFPVFLLNPKVFLVGR